MIRAAAALSVVEAAYCLEGDERAWLAGIAKAALPMLEGVGSGVVASVAAVDRGRVVLRARAMAGGNLAYLDRVSALEARAPREWWESKHRASQCGTSLEAFPESGLPMSFFHDEVANAFAEYGVHDVFNIYGADISGHTVCLQIPLNKISKVHPRVRHTWKRVSAHLAAGLRLRNALQHGAVLDSAEAIFDADHHCVHASGSATEPALRQLLQNAAIAVDRARAECGTDASTALDLWRGLFGGQWSKRSTAMVAASWSPVKTIQPSRVIASSPAVSNRSPPWRVLAATTA